ncbi:MAG: hypothetical protein HOO06_07045 [Bdellovibrionaceae bacterium]|nr:hypothetical protein [Pseudobdellovibrionaceae bacterium]
MKIEAFLHYITNTSNNTLIINILFIAILMLIIIWVFIAIKSGDAASDSPEGNLKDIEDTLKKVLERTSIPMASGEAAVPQAISELSPDGGATPGEPADPGVSNAELEALQKDLESKKAEIEELKAEGAKATGGASIDDAELKELNTKLGELEAKLQEYEIIEDDIADLSLFKEENTVLKQELEKLKAGGATAAPDNTANDEIDTAPKAEPVVEEEVKAPEEAAVAAAEEAPTEEESKEEKTEEAPVETGEITDDLVAEFAAAVESPEPPKPETDNKVEEPAKVEAKTEEPVASEEAISEIEQAVAASSSAKQEAEDNFITDDVLAEFAAAVTNELDPSELEPEKEKVKDEPVAAEEKADDAPPVMASADDIDAMFGDSAETTAESTAAPEEVSTEDESKAEDAPPVMASADDIDALFGDGADTPSESSEPEKKEEAAGAEDEGLLGGAIDTSKMMSEVEDLSNLVVDGSENALEEEMDVDKMAAEAMNLGGSE